MKKFWAICAVSLFAVALSGAGDGEWTGYITDTHCGKDGANKDHSVGCVEKCMKSGSKAQILNEGDKKIYDLDSFEKVKSLVGKKVVLKGTLDEKSNTITVSSASAAAVK